jgi:hypothetical protein
MNVTAGLFRWQALRERMGREASPSAAVLNSQSVKSAEKGVAETTPWVTTPARR